MSTAHDVLVIDDEPVVLNGVERICGSEGLTVDGAATGEAGLDRLEHHVYRLILCDIMMESMDGFQFLVESGRRGNRIPVVMTTGYATVENAVRSLQSGAIDFLSKPFTADELMAIIHRALNFSALKAGSMGTSLPRSFHRLGYVSWAAVEPEGTVRIGINEHFVKAIKGIRSIELASAGAELVQGLACASITSSDGLVHSVMCPVSGKVIEIHADVAAEPSAIEKDSYGAGWLYRILPSDLEHSLESLTPPSNLEGEPP